MEEKYIKVNRPSGTEKYKVLHAFEKDGNKYIVIDSKLKDSNQLTITFISKINGSNLEYMEGKEWDDFVKQELIPVVKGVSDSICFEPQEEYQAGEQFGHPLALKDAHVSALITNYQLPVENNFEEVQPIVETKENLQVENQINEIPIIEESQVALQPEVSIEENYNNESQEILPSDPVMAISPEPEINNISPIEQSVVDNNLNKAIENVNMAGEVFPFQEPIISDQPLVTDDVQPEVQIVNTTVSDSVEINEFDLLQNNVVKIFEKLKTKEKQLNDKENELKEKEEQLNKKESELKEKVEQLEIDKKQVEEDKKNNDTYSQVLAQTQERWKQNGVQVPEVSDYSQTQMSDFPETNNQVIIQDSPEEGLSRTLSQVA